MMPPVSIDELWIMFLEVAKFAEWVIPEDTPQSRKEELYEHYLEEYTTENVDTKMFIEDVIRRMDAEPSHAQDVTYIMTGTKTSEVNPFC